MALLDAAKHKPLTDASGRRAASLDLSKELLVLRDGTEVNAEKASSCLGFLRRLSSKDQADALPVLYDLAHGHKPRAPLPADSIVGLMLAENNNELGEPLKSVLINALDRDGDRIAVRDPFLRPEQNHKIGRRNHYLLEAIDADTRGWVNGLVEEIERKKRELDDKGRSR